MGLDLMVIVDRYSGHGFGDVLDTNQLAFDREYALFDRIKALPSELLARPVVGHRSDELRVMDQLDVPLRCVRAQAFRGLDQEAGFDEWTPWNRGILRFLAEIPGICQVILDWN